jgi:ADP-heptose:LPS heptosyltransferase
VKILAIRLARLGDVILLLPALSSLKQAFPDSHLTFLTGHRCAPLAELCPAIDEVMAVDRVAMRDGPIWTAARDMVRVVRDVRRRRFDLVIDFHSFRETNLLTWLSGAPVRMGMKRYRAPYLEFCFNRLPVLEDKSLHVAEMFQRVVGSLPSPAAPEARQPSPGGRGLVIPESVKHPRGRKLVLYVDAPVPERIWPSERFAEVADFAVEKLDASVIVISSQEGAERAKSVRKGSRNPGHLSVFTDLTLPQLAGFIGSSRLFVSNDTGPMHIGPAVGVPTLGLFSVGYPEHFRPIGPSDKFLRANPIEKIEVKDVIGAVEEMWATADRDLRR